MDNELPAEVMEKLNREALEKYPAKWHRVQMGLPTDLNEYERELWLSGATEYAAKLHDRDKKIELLMKSRQNQNEFIHKATDLLGQFLKKYDSLYEWKDGLYREIKSFLDGK
jgi:hypothetical protein